MEKDQIKTVMQVELRKGTPPQEVCDMALSAGLPSAQIRGIFMNILPYYEAARLQIPPDDKLVTTQSLDKEKKEQEKEGEISIPSGQNVFWDPSGNTIAFGEFKKERKALYKKFKYLQDHSYLLKLSFLVAFLIGAVVLVSMGYWWVIDIDSAIKFLFGSGDDNGMFLILLLAWIPLLGFLSYVKNLQVDLVKERISEKNKWVYNPSESVKHWYSLRDKFPFVFKKGNKSQNVQDEIWGRYKNENQDVDFYSGIFEYHVETGNGKRSRKTRYFQTFFGIHLNEKLDKDLILTPNSKIKKIYKSLLSNKISLESVEFNEIFSVEYGGKKEEKLDIFKMLSPAVQWELIRLGKESRDLKILFSGDTFWFSQSGFLFQKAKVNFIFRFIIGMVPFARQAFIRKMNSNFIKRVEIDKKDEDFLEKKIESLLRIATEIPQYLD